MSEQQNECICGKGSFLPDCPRHGVESDWYLLRRPVMATPANAKLAFDALLRIAIGIYGRKQSGLLSNESDSNNMPKTDWQLAQDAIDRILEKK